MRAREPGAYTSGVSNRRGATAGLSVSINSSARQFDIPAMRRARSKRDGPPKRARWRGWIERGKGGMRMGERGGEVCKVLTSSWHRTRSFVSKTFSIL